MKLLILIKLNVVCHVKVSLWNELASLAFLAHLASQAVGAVRYNVLAFVGVCHSPFVRLGINIELWNAPEYLSLSFCLVVLNRDYTLGIDVVKFQVEIKCI